MSKPDKALLLVGSPKETKSTSASIGEYLLKHLAQDGLTVTSIHVHQVIKSAHQQEVLKQIADADILIFSFPLYVDSLPAPATRALEIIAKHRHQIKDEKKPLFFCIANSGFPEAAQSQTALAICRCFAKEAGFEWAGGLAVGGGAAIDGQSFEKVRFICRKSNKSLKQIASALAAYSTQPSSLAEENIFIDFPFPVGLYRVVAKWGMKQMARKNCVEKNIYDQPHLKA